MYILESIYNLILELAYDRDKVEDIVTNLSDQILLHFIKILKWDSPKDLNGHKKSLNSWLLKLQQTRLRNGKRVRSKDYYQWLFIEKIESVNDLNVIINIKLEKYKVLPELLSNEQLYFKLKEIYDKLCLDLSDGKFEGVNKYFL
jgi:hypothetical protein